MNTTLNDLCKQAHENSLKKGWWETERSFLEVLALIHSEVSEALEEYRKGKGITDIYVDSSNPNKPEGIPIELADVLIRIFDFCGRTGINLDYAVGIKMEYNTTRSYK